MKSPLVPLLLGLAFVTGAILIDSQQRALQGSDVRDIAGLLSELDSVRAAHALASNAADSARLASSIETRTYILGRREFHVPSRQAAIDAWWSPTGPGTLVTGIGVLLMGLAVFSHLRARDASA